MAFKEAYVILLIIAVATVIMGHRYRLLCMPSNYDNSGMIWTAFDQMSKIEESRRVPLVEMLLSAHVLPALLF